MPDKKDFIGIFKAETEDNLTNLDKGLVELEKAPHNLEIIKELNRMAHTIKGSARVFEFYDIQEIAHKIEDIFGGITTKEITFSRPVADCIFRGVDLIRKVLEADGLTASFKDEIEEICEELENHRKGVGGKRKAPKAAQEEPRAAKVENKEESAAAPEKKEVPHVVPPEKEEIITRETVLVKGVKTLGGKHVEEYIRVPLSRVNKLLNLVGEMVINKMESSEKIGQAKRLSRMAKESQKDVAVLTEVIKRKHPFLEMEISKLLGQCNVNVERIKDSLQVLYDTISTEAFHLDPVIDELQSRMKEIRMLPISTIFEGFPRMIRDIASQEEKDVKLEINGGETELDKKVLEGVKAPLMHILRNSISHGVESPDDRMAIGKPRQGTVKINAFHEAGNVKITVEDDGRGIDPDGIRLNALKKNLISQEELNTMSERALINLIFMNGYSTSPIITDVSGRGIGLDAARRDIEALKGQVTLDTVKGKGTVFTLVLPLTIAIIQVLLFEIEGVVFALPMTSVEECIKVKRSDIATLKNRMAAHIRGHNIPIVKMNDIIQLPSSGEKKKSTPAAKPEEDSVYVIISSSLEKRVGFIVDDIIGEDEIFIKNLGEHLGKVKNVSGATILGTGAVVVILDAKDLIEYSAMSHPAVTGKRRLPHEDKRQRKLLVVEDSLSTRELEKNILESHGYLVDTAVDGLDALDKVAKNKYDLIVSDVQMPRMDGFEFCRTLNKNEDYKDIPVVIMTALEKESDKRLGIEVGAAAYIVKTAFDQGNLLDTIERLIG